MARKPESTTGQKPNRSFRVARISVFCSLSVIGSFIHFPGPIQTVAFDSAPGFFVALYFGAFDGAVVAGIGHVATSIVNGFPLGLLHIPIALGLALAGGVIGLVNKRWNGLAATCAGVALNTGLIVIVIPVLGLPATLSFLPFLFLAAALNGFVALAAYTTIRRRFPNWLR
jgi:uncharacterized membrane protein